MQWPCCMCAGMRRHCSQRPDAGVQQPVSLHLLPCTKHARDPQGRQHAPQAAPKMQGTGLGAHGLVSGRPSRSLQPARVSLTPRPAHSPVHCLSWIRSEVPGRVLTSLGKGEHALGQAPGQGQPAPELHRSLQEVAAGRQLACVVPSHLPSSLMVEVMIHQSLLSTLALPPGWTGRSLCGRGWQGSKAPGPSACMSPLGQDPAKGQGSRPHMMEHPSPGSKGASELVSLSPPKLGSSAIGAWQLC